MRRNRKPVLLLDVDDVLADFTGGYLQAVFMVTGRKIPTEKVCTWDVSESIFDRNNEGDRALIDACEMRVASQGFCSNLLPTPGSVEAVKALLEAGVNLHIVTTPLEASPTWVFERTQWLWDNFGIDKKKIHYTHSKEMIGGDLFIDDKPSNVLAWTSRHRTGTGFLWTTGANAKETGLDRLSSWGALLERVL